MNNRTTRIAAVIVTCTGMFFFGSIQKPHTFAQTTSTFPQLTPCSHVADHTFVPVAALIGLDQRESPYRGAKSKVIELSGCTPG